jgi:hypothetical protein
MGVSKKHDPPETLSLADHLFSLSCGLTSDGLLATWQALRTQVDIPSLGRIYT